MNNTNLIRLQKFLSSAGVASRRASEEIIKSGVVTVDDVIITELGTKVSGDEVIRVKGKVVKPIEKKYIILNKPEGYLCTRKDTHGRKTVFDLLGEDDDSSLIYVGRLDCNSKGLLVLTNDGDFAHNTIHPSTGVIKKYQVSTSKKVDSGFCNRFKAGINIEGENYKAVECVLNSTGNELLITLKEGKKREIREVLQDSGYNVVELKRIAFGKLELNSLNLLEGEYRFIKFSDIKKMIRGE